MTGRLTRIPLAGGFYLPNTTMEPLEGGNFTSGNLEPEGLNFAFAAGDPGTGEFAYLPPEGNGGYGPRVEILFTGLNPAGAVNVWRECEDQRFLVRSGVRRSGTDAVVIVDSEVPFGRPVIYRAEMLNADFTSAGFTPGVQVILDRSVMGDDYGKSYVHNVLEPSSTLEYVFAGDALDALTQGHPGGFAGLDGSPYPLWVGGRSSALVDVNVSGSTYTLDDYRTLAGMFGTRQVPKVPILVFRTPPELLLPPTFFAAVTTRTPQPVNVAWGGGEWVRWAMAATEVAPPFPGLSEPGVTLADLATRFDTLAEVAEVYPTLLDAARDYSLAGLAGR